MNNINNSKKNCLPNNVKTVHLPAAILLFSILAIFTSCAEKSASHVADGTLNDLRPTTAIGDIVTKIDNSIWYIFQDRRNSYWFGSRVDGVYRYDGKIITHFTTKDGLPSNQISGIQEDKSGNIFFSTLGSDGGRRCVHQISKFDGKAFTTLFPKESNLPDGDWRLQPDDLWFAGAQDSGVVYRYDGQTLHVLRFPKIKAGDDHVAKYSRAKYPNLKYSPYDVYYNFKDSYGHMWFGTASLGVCHYDGKSFTWISKDELEIDPGDASFGVRSIIEDKDGQFWFTNTFHRWGVDRKGVDGKGIIYTKGQGIRTSVDQSTDPVEYFMSSVNDDNGDLWMATYGAGVWRYEYDGKQLIHYPVKDDNKPITLFSIYKDNKNDLWLGTHAAGVYKFNGKSFEKFKP